MKKKVIISIVLLCLLSLISTVALAKTIPNDAVTVQSTIKIADKIVDPLTNPGHYEPGENNPNDSKVFTEIGSTIIAALKAIGTLIMVVTLMILGIRYMIAGASEKANFKETMVPYLIGAIMVFAIPQIVGIIYNLVKTIE